MYIVYVYAGFWTDHSRIESRVDENQLVRVEPTTMRVVQLCLIPITGFSVNLSSNHCVISLQDFTEHFRLLETPQQVLPELSISTTIIHDYCVPFPTLMIHYSQYFLLFLAT